MGQVHLIGTTIACFCDLLECDQVGFQWRNQAAPSTIELLLQAQRSPEYPRAVRSEDEIPQDLRRHPVSQRISFPTLARTYPTYDSPRRWSCASDGSIAKLARPQNTR